MMQRREKEKSSGLNIVGNFSDAGDSISVDTEEAEAQVENPLGLQQKKEESSE